jgi:hypothetical protein
MLLKQPHSLKAFFKTTTKYRKKQFLFFAHLNLSRHFTIQNDEVGFEPHFNFAPENLFFF